MRIYVESCTEKNKIQTELYRVLIKYLKIYCQMDLYALLIRSNICTDMCC